MLGSGSYRVITLSAAAQSKRWTNDLLKILNIHSARPIHMQEIPDLYQVTHKRQFNANDYGVCTLEELMEKVTPDAVRIDNDGCVSFPQQTDVARQFALEVTELLCYTPNLRMEFSRFVPAYHAHYGRQLRVAQYGCVKLMELFHMIPNTVTLDSDPTGERVVRLSPAVAQSVMAQRLKALVPVALATLPSAYAAQFGAPPRPDTLDVSSLEALVYAAGGVVDGGTVHAADDPSRLAGAAMAACAVLSSDRSISRGSTLDYFVGAFRSLHGHDPNVMVLTKFGILETVGRQVCLTAAWRVVWRVAQIIASRSVSLSAMEILIEYTNRYGPPFPKTETEGKDTVAQ